MNKKVTWGVLGVANIALKKVLPAMQRGERCQIAAIASRDLKKAEQAAQLLGIRKAFGSYEELLPSMTPSVVGRHLEPLEATLPLLDAKVLTPAASVPSNQGLVMNSILLSYSRFLSNLTLLLYQGYDSKIPCALLQINVQATSQGASKTSGQDVSSILDTSTDIEAGE